MTAVDFPDFFRGDQWSTATPFVNEVFVQRGAGKVTWGPFYMAPWEAVVITSQTNTPTLAGLYGVVHWYADAGLTSEIGQQVFDAYTGFGFSDIFPAMGPWMTVDLTYHSGAGTALTTTLIVPRKGIHGWARYIADGVLLSTVGLSIAAGGTSLINPRFVAGGRAALSVFTNATGWIAQCNAVSPAGVKVAQLATLGPGTPTVANQAALYVPPHLTQMAVTNQDAGARIFDVSIVLDLGW